MRNKIIPEKNNLLLAVGLIVAVVVLLPANWVRAQTPSYDQQYNELKAREQKKADLQAKINGLISQEKTLANQIAYLENQIKLTLLQQEESQAEIIETQSLINDVNGDIESVSGRLDNLDGSIKDLHSVLSARIRTTYQLENAGGVGYLIDAKNVRQLVLHTAYLRSLQKEDKRLFSKMQDTRGVYQIQKESLEQLKTEKEELKAQLEYQNQLLEKQEVDLANQQGAKKWLLTTTKNQESEYKKLLSQIEEEIRAIRNALTSVGTKIGSVKKGDVIGRLGNTGCSTGPHLHFGYYVGGVAIDPKPSIDSGVLAWPVKDPLITQYFGENYEWYRVNFGINGHNGIDMVDGTLGFGAPILAAADGTAYKVSDSQKCWLTGTVGQGVRIDHPDGSKTIYWHLQ